MRGGHEFAIAGDHGEMMGAGSGGNAAVIMTAG